MSIGSDFASTSYVPGPGNDLSDLLFTLKMLYGLSLTMKFALDLNLCYLSKFYSTILYALGPGVCRHVMLLFRPGMLLKRGSPILEKIADEDPSPASDFYTTLYSSPSSKRELVCMSPLICFSQSRTKSLGSWFS